MNIVFEMMPSDYERYPPEKLLEHVRDFIDPSWHFLREMRIVDVPEGSHDPKPARSIEEVEAILKKEQS